jgi:hypothetical protein
MTYLVSALVVVWFGGVLFLAGQHLNDIRVVLNHIEPGASSAGTQPLQPRWSHETGITLLDAVFIGPILAIGVLLARRFLKLDGFAGRRASKIDPACLTEAGRVHLGNAIRHERIMFAWSAVGCILLVLVGSYHFGM